MTKEEFIELCRKVAFTHGQKSLLTITDDEDPVSLWQFSEPGLFIVASENKAFLRVAMTEVPDETEVVLQAGGRKPRFTGRAWLRLVDRLSQLMVLDRLANARSVRVAKKKGTKTDGKER